MRPYGLKSDSRSGCDMFFGNPDTYKLAPLIASELGRANETCSISTKVEQAKALIIIQRIAFVIRFSRLHKP